MTNIIQAPIDITPLRTDGTGTGYKNVYQKDCRNGVPRYCARVKRGRKLMYVPGAGTFRSPFLAAQHVARWYHDTFGPHWATLLKTNARKRPPVAVWWSDSRGGYLARVWLKGTPREVVPLEQPVPCELPRPVPNAEPLTFATKTQARAAIRRFVLDQYGTWGVVFR